MSLITFKTHTEFCGEISWKSTLETPTRIVVIQNLGKQFVRMGGRLMQMAQVKVKIKVSLGLTKHHAMKAYWGMDL